MPADRPCIFGRRKKKPLIKPLVEQPEPKTDAPVTVQIQTQAAHSQPVADIQGKSRPTTSLKELLKSKEETVQIPVTQLQTGSSDFTQDDLLKFWAEYANALDNKKIHLKNTLLNCKPTLGKDFSFEVGVYNPAQKDDISENAADIVNYLAVKLKNSRLKMSIRVLEQRKEEMIYTATEKFNYLKDKNPEFEKLVEAFELVAE